MKHKPSPELEADALQVAKSTQKPGQTKEQTKLIAKGIEKGIAEYKKQHSKKLREIDKQRKQKSKLKQREVNDVVTPESVSHSDANLSSFLPWVLLVLSWVGFAVYILV